MPHIGMRHTARIVTVALLALVAMLLVTAAASAARVTVRVEGSSRALLAPTVVTIGTGSGTARTWNGSGSLPSRCADDTAYQAVELAVSGNWDRNLYIETVLRETHTWSPNTEQWILYHGHDFADWGLCDLHLTDGDSILLQAGVSGAAPNYIPDSVPIELTRIGSGNIAPGGRLTVQLTAWIPTDIFGTQDPRDPNHWIIPASPSSTPSGYTVTAGSASGTTDSRGQAVITMRDTGRLSVGASVSGSSTNWSRAVPFSVCVTRTSC